MSANASRLSLDDVKPFSYLNSEADSSKRVKEAWKQLIADTFLHGDEAKVSYSNNDLRATMKIDRILLEIDVMKQQDGFHALVQIVEAARIRFSSFSQFFIDVEEGELSNVPTMEDVRDTVLQAIFKGDYRNFATDNGWFISTTIEVYPYVGDEPGIRFLDEWNERVSFARLESQSDELEENVMLAEAIE